MNIEKRIQRINEDIRSATEQLNFERSIGRNDEVKAYKAIIQRLKNEKNKIKSGTRFTFKAGDSASYILIS